MAPAKKAQRVKKKATNKKNSARTRKFEKDVTVVQTIETAQLMGNLNGQLCIHHFK